AGREVGGRAVSFFCLAYSSFISAATRESRWASSIQCSATLSYGLLMDGSVACVASRLASSALRRQMSLSDDIRGGSSNAPNQEEKPRRSGAKGICGRRVFGLPQRDNSERGGWFQKEKPRRATGPTIRSHARHAPTLTPLP